jgi:hypothetical protein
MAVLLFATQALGQDAGLTAPGAEIEVIWQGPGAAGDFIAIAEPEAPAASFAVRTKLPSRLDKKWQGVTAICRIERIRELKACCTREVIYAIISLPEDKLDAATLLQLARDHWQIENRLHHIRDVSFGEDACHVRSGSAPQILAELRNTVLTMIRQTGQQPKPAREAFAERKWSAIKLVMGS